MTTNDFLKMLKVAAATPNGHAVGSGLADVMSDPNSTANSQGWLDYIKHRTNSVTSGLSGSAAQRALDMDRQQNPDKWDFGKMRADITRAAQQQADETRRWRKDNTGYFSNASWNPLTWGLMGKQVDVKGFSQRLNDLAARANSATDPVERAKLIAQHNAAMKQWDKDYARFMKHVDAPLHVARRVDEWSGVSWLRDKAIQGMTLGKKRGLADWAIGRNADGSTISSDDLAKEYGQAVYAYTGDAQKAQSAERWLRATGATAAVANNVLELLATKGLSTKLQAAHKLQQAEKIYNAARVGNIAFKGTTKARLAATGIHAASEGLKSWRFWHAINPATAGLSDVITNGGQAETGTLGGVVSGAANIANMIGVSSPIYNAGGTLIAGTMGTLLPGATRWVTQTPWKAGWQNPGRNFASRGWNSVKQFAKYNAPNPLKFQASATGGNMLTRGVKNGISYLGYQFGNPVRTVTHALASDAFKSGIPMEVYEIAGAIKDGRAPSLSPMLGFRNGLMLSGISEVGGGIADKSDAVAAFRHGTSFNDVIDEARTEIASNPETRERIIQNMNLRPDASDKEVLDAYLGDVGRMRYVGAVQAAMGAADPDKDPEGFRKELYNQYRSMVAQGGPVGSNMFYDGSLPQAEREKLLQLHIMAEDRRINGVLKANPVSQLVRGKDDVLIDTMKQSPSAREGVIAYGAGLLNDGLNGSSSGMNMTEDQRRRLKLIWGELNPSERRQMLAPIMTASPEQLMNMMNSGALGNMDKHVTEVASDMVFDRLASDAQFRGAFIPAFMTRSTEGGALSPEMKQRALDFLRNTDPSTLMEGMGMDEFRKLSRLMMSGGGTASGLLSELPEEQRTQLVQAFTAAAKKKALSLAWANPIKNLPILASLYAESMGWNGVASALENPAVFYGGAALLLGGGVLLAGSMLRGDDDAGEDKPGLLGRGKGRADAGDMVKELNKQRELLADNVAASMI